MGIFKRAAGPIGVLADGDVVRLAQTSPDGRELVATSHAEIRSDGNERHSEPWAIALGEAISTAYRVRDFQGRDFVGCIRASDLTLLNIRVPTGDPEQVQQAVQEDVQARLPYGAADAVIRHVEAGTIHQADSRKCEVVAVACHQQCVNSLLIAAERARLNPIAIDVEPGAMQRAYFNQFRHGEEQKNTSVIVHVGYHATCIVIHHDGRVHLAKHLPAGGLQMNEAVASSFELDNAEAARLRNRAAAGGSSEGIKRALHDAARPLVEQMAREISLCIRYYSVTFRATRADEILLMGPEAGPGLAEAMEQRVGVPCRCSKPFERLGAPQFSRPNQWDLPIGLALKGAMSA